MPISGISAHHATHETGGPDAVTPCSHVASHAVGGSDAITWLPVRVTKQVSESKHSDTTLAPDAELTIPVEANSVYDVKLVLHHYSVTGKYIKTLWVVPSGSTLYGVRIDGASLDPRINLTTQYNLSATATGNSTTVWHCRLATSATAGNLLLQWAQYNTDVADETIYNGSFIEVKKVG